MASSFTTDRASGVTGTSTVRNYSSAQKAQIERLLNAYPKYHEAVQKRSVYSLSSLVTCGLTVGLLGLATSIAESNSEDKNKLFIAAGVSGTLFTISMAFEISSDNKVEHIRKQAEKRVLSQPLIPRK